MNRLIEFDKLATLAKADPVKALDGLQSSGDTEIRRRFIYELLPQLAESNLEKATELLDTGGAISIFAGSVIARELAATDPSRAVKWITMNAPEKFRESLLELLLDDTFRRDPSQALRIAAQTGSLGFKTPIGDPKTALDAVAAAPPSKFRNEILSRALPQLAMTDFKAAEAWAQILPEGDLKTQALSQLDARRYLEYADDLEG